MPGLAGVSIRSTATGISIPSLFFMLVLLNPVNDGMCRSGDRILIWRRLSNDEKNNDNSVSEGATSKSNFKVSCFNSGAKSGIILGNRGDSTSITNSVTLRNRSRLLGNMSSDEHQYLVNVPFISSVQPRNFD